MDKLLNNYFKIFFQLLFFLQFLTNSFSQSYLMSIENGQQVNSNTFEFDIFIKSTNSSFTLTSYQCAFTFKEANNGGTLTFSYLSGTSQLTNIPSCGIGIYQFDGARELTFASFSGSDNITTTAKKVGRFRLQSTTAYASPLFEITWNFQGVVNTILTGSAFDNLTDSSFHSNLAISADTISPALLNASATSIETVELNFSEQISQASAGNISNYIINNRITVINAVLSSTRTFVTLTTTPATPGTAYTVTLNNIRDLAGNLISPSSNSAQYLFEDSKPLVINVKVFLEGPYNNGSMNNSLNSAGSIPLIQPFNASPWNYTGLETVQSIPANVVDWVLIELRAGTAGSTSLIKKAAFIKTDGTIVDLDGISKLKIKGINTGKYYIVINHRNHIGIMSSDKIELSNDPAVYDFTTALNKAYGSSQVKLDNGIYGMYSGDANGNGNINKADLNSVWKQQNGLMGYLNGDFDMNGGVNISDKNLCWKVNEGISSSVPN